MNGPGPVAPSGWQGPAGRVNVHAAAFNPTHSAPPMAPQNQIAVGVSTWAQDFAQYNAARHQQQQQQVAPNGVAIPPGQLIQHNHLETPMSAPSLMNTYMQPNFGLPPVYGPTNGGFHDPVLAAQHRPAREAEFNSEVNKWMAANGDTTAASSAHAKAMEDVDAIMEQIARDLELQQQEAEAAVAENVSAPAVEESRVASSTTAGTMEQIPLSHTLEHAHFTDLEVPEMQNLSISAPEQPVVAQAPVADTEEIVDNAPKAKSEVAQAAERLLDSLKDEDGEKWQNSTFLSLMRDFRDGRKDIVDNEVRDTEEDVATGPSNGKGKEPAAPSS